MRAVQSRAQRRPNAIVRSDLARADLVYLIRNEDRDWIDIDPQRTVLVGSTHCDDLSGGALALRSRWTRGRWGRLYRRLMQREANKPSDIRAYHVTQPVYWESRIKRRPLDAYVPLGVDTETFRPDPAIDSHAHLRFLFVGGLDLQKGTDLLLEAWRRFPQEGPELHIVGFGPLRSRVEQRARADRRIHFHGTLSPPDLAELYRRCDVFLFPSRFDTLGLVVLEALASGLYVVATESVRGVFDEWAAAGFLEYCSNDPNRLRTRIADLVDHRRPADYNHRVAQHRAIRVRQDWQAVSRDLYAWFDRLLVRPRPEEPPQSAPRRA